MKMRHFYEQNDYIFSFKMMTNIKFNIPVTNLLNISFDDIMEVPKTIELPLSNKNVNVKMETNCG